jgi:hypothetical protein
MASMAEVQEREFMGGQKSRMWTYLILGVLLISIVIVINLVWKNPAAAKDGFKHFLGMPAWAIATVTFLVGSVVFWIGLKIETDWPEAIGAFLISASVVAFELMLGWSKLELGGLFVVPYLIPLTVFVLLLMYGMKRSA